MSDEEAKLRRDIVAAARQMNAIGINQGTSGNISARCGAKMLMTPSATPYEDMRPKDIAARRLDDDADQWRGKLPPSTEWRMHLGILRGRPDAGAVVHTHAPYCTALSILRREIPAVHYMVALFGGASIRCAEYATFGTAALAAFATQALDGRNACLLANHGMVVIGPTLARAMWLAAELETLAKHYVLAAQIGPPMLLSEAEVAASAERFASYGPHAPRDEE